MQQMLRADLIKCEHEKRLGSDDFTALPHSIASVMSELSRQL